MKINSKTHQIEELRCKNGILGVYSEFEYEDATSTLDSGDVILMYTDGVLDVEDGNDKTFGENVLY